MDTEYNVENLKWLYEPQESWLNAIEDICVTRRVVDNVPYVPLIFIAGSKNVGKSTLARLFLNKLLESFPQVVLLDCDLGQSEYTPPGIVSLNVVERSIDGFPFQHLRTPEISYFLGETSPKNRPDMYLVAIWQLYQIYRTRYGRAIPLVVNTQGWIKGLGLELLHCLLCFIHVTELVVFKHRTSNDDDHSLRLLEDISKIKDNPLLSQLDLSIRSRNGTSNTLSAISSPSYSVHSVNPFISANTKKMMTASDLRELCISVYFYFDENEPSVIKVPSDPFVAMEFFMKSEKTFGSLLRKAPFEISFSQLAFYADSSLAGNDAVFRSLEATVVGLLILENSDDSYQYAKRQKKDSDECALKLLDKFPIDCECVGLGIIRAIDRRLGKLYLNTPISLERLKRVNLICASALELPTHIVMCTPRKMLDEFTPIPYFTTVPSRGIGLATRKTRPNLQRKSQMTG